LKMADESSAMKIFPDEPFMKLDDDPFMKSEYTPNYIIQLYMHHSYCTPLIVVVHCFFFAIMLHGASS